MTTDDRTLNFPQRGEMTLRWASRSVEIELLKIPGRAPTLKLGRDLINLEQLDDLIGQLREARYALAVLVNLHGEGLLPALAPAPYEVIAPAELTQVAREEAPSEEGARGELRPDG